MSEKKLLDRNEINVRGGKGNKDRRTLLPLSVRESLQNQIKSARFLHEQDLREGFGEVYFPKGLARKYPGAAREWIWQYVFPAPNRFRDPRTFVVRRHYLHPSSLRRAIRVASRQAGSLNMSLPKSSATASPLIYWRMVITSAPSRSC